MSINKSDTPYTGDMQFDDLFNNFFSQFGSELRQQISISVKDPLSFFDVADSNFSAIRLYESTPNEVGMLNGEFPNKDSLSDKIPTSIYV